MMNRWGAMAEDHWATYRPLEYAAMPDKNQFFTTLGEQLSQEIIALSLSIAGDDRPGEGFFGKVGRLNMARLMAQEQVLRESLPISEEDEATGDE
jgi:hypothetical protein